MVWGMRGRKVVMPQRSGEGREVMVKTRELGVGGSSGHASSMEEGGRWYRLGPENGLSF